MSVLCLSWCLFDAELIDEYCQDYKKECSTDDGNNKSNLRCGVIGGRNCLRGEASWIHKIIITYNTDLPEKLESIIAFQAIFLIFTNFACLPAVVAALFLEIESLDTLCTSQISIAIFAVIIIAFCALIISVYGAL